MTGGCGKLVRLYHQADVPMPVISNQDGKTYTIGRQFREVGERMELIICISEFVSRHHCDVMHRNGAFWIRDHQSLNGTFLNGNKIASRVDRELRFGDIIGLGVSHTAIDVDVRSKDYFLFRFQEVEVPVIDLGDDEDDEVQAHVPPVTSSDNRAAPSPPVARVEPQRVFIGHATPKDKDNDSSSDIEILDDEPVRASTASPKKSIPSPPPPPVLSKKKKKKPLVGPASFKRKMEQREKNRRRRAESRDVASKPSNRDKPATPPSSIKSISSRQEKTSSSNAPTKKDGKTLLPVSSTEKLERSSKSTDQKSKSGVKKYKRIQSLDSSDDDSSDGLPHNEGQFVPNIDFNPENDELRGHKHRSHKKTEVNEDDLSDNSKKSKSSNKSLSKNFSKDRLLQDKKKAIIKLRKVITERGDLIHMRKKYTSKFSPEELDKILNQYLESKRRNSKPKSESDDSNSRRTSSRSKSESEDASSSSSDIDSYFEKVVVKKKTLEKATGRANKRKIVEEQFSSDVSSDMESSEEISKPVKKKTKKSLDYRKSVSHKINQKTPEGKKDERNHKRPNNKRDKPELSTKKDYSPSNMDEQKPGCSKDLYPPSAFRRQTSYSSLSEDNAMDFSDGEGNRSDNYDVHSKDRQKDDGRPKESGRRQVKMLDHAPAPLQVRKIHEKTKRLGGDRQNCLPVSSVNPNKRNSPPSKVTMRAEDVKKARQEKLQQIEANKRAAETSHKAPPTPKAAPVRAKIHARNRNQEFIDDFMSSAKDKEPGEKESEALHIPVEREPVKGIPAPRREIPAPKISPSKLPVGLITREMDRSKVDHENRTRIVTPPTAPPPTLRQPWHSRNLMEKEGSSLARASHPVETSHKTIINYHHGQAEPVTTVLPTKAQSSAQKQDLCELFDDEAYLVISRWNPSWLHEEQNSSTMPPLLNDIVNGTLTRTLYNYDSYKSYMDVMFPLLMVEIWATIGSDYFETRKSESQYYRSPPDEINEHSFVIEKITKEEICPMISSRATPPKDRNWTSLACYGLEPPGKRIGTKKDLAIVTLTIEIANKKGAVEKKEKDYFGWILFQSQRSRAIDGKVNEDLKKLTPGAKKKFNFKIVISTSGSCKILMDKPAHIKRVCYISPKLRDYKALFFLKLSLLFPKIINLQPPSHPFDPNARVPPHYLIPLVSKLNPTQKAVVAYVCERVNSPTPELMLLHGAPGVGKSRTIVAMIFQILSKVINQPNPKKILVCTPSNTAIDELMRRIDETLPELPNGQSIKMVRIGEAKGSPASLKKYMIDTMARQRVDMASTTSNISKEIEQTAREIEDKKLEIETLVKSKGSKTTVESLKRELKEVQHRKDDFQRDLDAKRKAIKDSDFNEAKIKIIEECHIVCSTLSSCSSSMLSRVFGSNRKNNGKKAFACCIVDEATQATEPETLNPLLLQVDKLVLVGDPCQLGATVMSTYASERGYELSLFSRLYHYYTVQKKIPNAVMMLTQQYRMHPEILAWPNDAFYKGSLKTNVIGRSSDDVCPLTPYIFLNLSGRESKVEGQISNELEVKLVLEVVRNIHLTTTLSSSERKWSLGVITPYRDQKGKIKEAIKRQLKAVADQVEVDTVDSFQGREKDVIIISCVRTDGTGFLNSKLRLNVALTRARHSLIMIGDAHCLKKENMWCDLIENARSRSRICDIQESSITNSKYLSKRLYCALSPSKSVVKDKD